MLTSTKDSFLRIMCVSSGFFSRAPTPNPTWRYFRDQAIPFGDSASGDYATCVKIATVKTFILDSPPPPSDPPSSKLSWRTHILMTEVWEPTLQVNSLPCNKR